MELSQHVDLRHELYLTTELKQGISILQMSAADLSEYVKQSVEENPFLDDDDWECPRHDFSAGEYAKTVSLEREAHDVAAGFVHHEGFSHFGDDESPFDRYCAYGESLADHLLVQLHLRFGEGRQRAIGEFILGCLDESGYLQVSVDTISSLFEAPQQEVLDVLAAIQRMDPIGVAARSVSECLRVQMEAKGMLEDLTAAFLDEHLESFGQRSPAQIANDMGVSLEQINEILDDLRTCNPRPGAQFCRPSDTIWPELVVEPSPDIEGELTVTLQDFYLPHLKVNPYYKTLAASQKGYGADKYLREKLKEAESLIDNIQYRKRTLYKVACCIVELQREFFERGLAGMRPLTMEKVAMVTGLSESTVSRVANGNYMQTPHGVYELRTFFQAQASSSLACEVSQASVKHRLAELVKQENPAKPLSDQALADLLKREGMDVSRRTVNKYRGELGIPPKSFRKRVG